MTEERAKKVLQEQIDRYGQEYDAEGIEALEMAIKALEQEPQTDEIILSKKEYRELLSDEFEHGYDKGLSDAITSLEQEPCEDAISRQAAIDAIWDGINMDIYTREVKECLEALPSVMPQQKVGKWIKSSIGGAKYADNCKKIIKALEQEQKTGRWFLSGGYWRCSECKEKALLKLDKSMGGCKEYMPIKSKYCPNCGAKMEVSKDE